MEASSKVGNFAPGLDPRVGTELSWGHTAPEKIKVVKTPKIGKAMPETH